jgi:ubiquinone/menaquinone biosynthesis C-methylase UbiE
LWSNDDGNGDVMNKENEKRKQLKDDATDPKWLLRHGILESLNKKAMSCLELIDEIHKSTGGTWKPSPNTIYPLLTNLQDSAYVKELLTEIRVKRFELTQSGKDLLVEQTQIKEKFIQDTIKEAHLKKGFQVLDFGCWPGRYVLAVSEALGAKGKLYALDTAPLALELVRKLVDKNKVSNVKTIESDCDTGLPDKELDVVLLYDAFHGLDDQKAVLSEVHRVLKPEGVLSFSDIHLDEKDIVKRVANYSLFMLKSKNQLTYTFVKT